MQENFIPVEYDSVVILRGNSGNVHKDYLKLIVRCLSIQKLCEISDFIFLTKPVITEYLEYVCRI